MTRLVDGTAPTETVPRSLRHSANVRILPQVTIAALESRLPGMTDVVATIPGVRPEDVALAHRIAAQLVEGSGLWDAHAAVGLPHVKRERFCMTVRVQGTEVGVAYLDALEVAVLAEVRKGRVTTHRVVRK